MDKLKNSKFPKVAFFAILNGDRFSYCKFAPLDRFRNVFGRWKPRPSEKKKLLRPLLPKFHQRARAMIPKATQQQVGCVPPAGAWPLRLGL
jgi:hypothetical protein